MLKTALVTCSQCHYTIMMEINTSLTIAILEAAPLYESASILFQRDDTQLLHALLVGHVRHPIKKSMYCVCAYSTHIITWDWQCIPLTFHLRHHV